MAKKVEKKKKPVKPRTDGCFKVPRITPRDYEIYELCKGQGQRQKDVAAKYRITQPRVSTIVNRVAQFLGTNCPIGYFELPREKRLVTLFRTHRMRLEHAFEEAMAAWNKSKEGQHRCKFKPVKGTKDHELIERIVTNRHGDQRHLDKALKYADRLMEFEGFDRRGQVDTTTDNRIYEAPDVTEIEAMRRIKAAAYRGDYDTEGDKGPPEWFLTKHGVKKPGNGYKPYIPDEVIFPTTNVMKAPESVITPSTGVMHNTQSVINNGNIIDEKQPFYSQAVTRQPVANYQSAEKVLYPTTATGSGLFSGEMMMPGPNDADPKIVPTPLGGAAVGSQALTPAQTPSPSSPQARSPEPGGSGYAFLPEGETKPPPNCKQLMWLVPEKDPKALPYMTLSDWQ